MCPWPLTPHFLLPSFLQSRFLTRSPPTVLLAPQSRGFSQDAPWPHDPALPEEGAREGVTDRHRAARRPPNLWRGAPQGARGPRWRFQSSVRMPRNRKPRAGKRIPR